MINDRTKEWIFDFTEYERITKSLPVTLVNNKEVTRVAKKRLLGYLLSDDLRTKVIQLLSYQKQIQVSSCCTR